MRGMLAEAESMHSRNFAWPEWQLMPRLHQRRPDRFVRRCWWLRTKKRSIVWTFGCSESYLPPERFARVRKSHEGVLSGEVSICTAIMKRYGSTMNCKIKLVINGFVIGVCAFCQTVLVLGSAGLQKI